MAQPRLALGLDLGTSGLRLAAVTPEGQVVAEQAGSYPAPFEQPEGWREALISLCRRLPDAVRRQADALAIAGTSGTLLLCRPDGSLAEGWGRGVNLAEALPYHRACPEQGPAAAAIALQGPASRASGSLARGLRLLQAAADAQLSGPWLLRHQADWLMGWLLGDWRWGEEGNNLRLGWDLQSRTWAGRIGRQPWSGALPQIRGSGEVLGALCATAVATLDLPRHCLVVAGSTDANAAVLAAAPGDQDGVCVLGTTLVLKQWCPRAIQAPGVSCHRVAGRWLVGGASNAGGGVLRRFFSDDQLTELSRQIDPSRHSGQSLLPLACRGERFPVDDPDLEPVLEPRPVSDALFLQGLLEGLAEIERAGWERLLELGAPPVQRVISLGGGARNPQWRAIRERLLQRPVLNRPRLSAAQGMARLAATALSAR
ncbi:FGGY-family carbohydrate kinase [Cyanobium sp. CH-040]|uniref:FGGY-family carbohydrate kinase n=1 Tax=Cyanobium sp. CH-040 TaxID=2823708 RepID=UPI0020CE4F50|nr:FGGY-family carbohydrate kinase [Cyanobium sp. CH-040]MCP9929118.1 sugar kinase [Cyanobium sp. CH-040]